MNGLLTHEPNRLTQCLGIARNGYSTLAGLVSMGRMKVTSSTYLRFKRKKEEEKGNPKQVV